jgi:hypothetical protein
MSWGEGTFAGGCTIETEANPLQPPDTPLLPVWDKGLYRKGEGLWLWGERLGGFDEFVQVLKN